MVDYSDNYPDVANLVALVIQIIKWTIFSSLS